VVETAAGKVRGVALLDVTAFFGVPYAVAPTGSLRFQAPQPPTPWRGVRDGLEAGCSIAVQHSVPPASESSPADGWADMSGRMDEDCLVVNVWTPAPDGRRRPVMVHCHGGAFWCGSGIGRWTDGANLARDEDVVVVSFNHRLHALGHLFLDHLDDGRYRGSGNAGLLDIVAVLHWVRTNIGAFGGDPNNVTLFGNSGGGWKISCLLAMPDAHGLFHRAIIQSGSLLRTKTAEAADRVTRRILARLRIPTARLHLLAEVPVKVLLAATAGLVPPSRPGRFFPDGTWSWDYDFAPVVDRTTLPTQPFEFGAPVGSASIPLLVGTTRDEFGTELAQTILPSITDPETKAVRLGMSPDVARRATQTYRDEYPDATGDAIFGEMLADALFLLPAISQAEARLRQTSASTYVYLFSWGWSRAGGRAVHTLEVPFVFGNLTPEILTAHGPPTTRSLSRQMMTAWAAFARTGDPNGSDLPRWEPYASDGRATMVFGHETYQSNDPRRRRRLALASRTDAGSRG
jgi:para-nitrobenzyl esterase